MINYLSLNIRSISISYVGNKVYEEGIILSKETITEIDDLTKEALIKYFIESFKREVYYNFFHSSDLPLNEVFHYASKIFDSPNSLHKISIDLSKHLYEKTTHPNIKGGEFYVVYFKNIGIDNLTTDAIGLFKSESKDTFLEVYSSKGNYHVQSHVGINIDKLDKGCLIFNTDRKNGFKVCIVDNLNKAIEAQYWKDDFLKVKPSSDSYHFTKDFLSVTKDFVTKQLPEEFEVTKSDQIDLLNRSVEYFKSREEFSKKEFEAEVLQDTGIIKSFRKFNDTFRDDDDLYLSDTFTISNQAVKKQSRIFRSVLKLDKNFHVYIHGNKEMIERGYDERKGLNYYKIYFKEEH